MKGFLAFLASTLLAGTEAPVVSGVEPPPKIGSLSPTVLQRGTPTEVTIAGERLAGIASLHLTGDSKVSVEIVKAEAAKVVVRLTAAAEAALGERELRAITPGGVSNPVSLVIGTLPVVLEVEPNNRAEQAQKIALPAQVLGSIHGATEIDAFRFEAKKDQRLLFNVHALRIGSKLDPTIGIYDNTGRQLARDDDSFGLDPFVEFTAPADGEYIVSIRDSLYRGGGEFAYQLEAGSFPFVESIFPLGGRRGTQVGVAVTGRNFEPGARIEIALEADAPLGQREVRAQTPMGPSNPRPFAVGDLPEFIEAEPNDVDAKANAVTAPIVLNGRIDKPRDVDLYRFNTGDFTQLVLEVVANRLGSPLDALITLEDGNGNAIQHNDDAQGGADARIDFNGFAKNKEYVVRIRDLVDRGGPTFGYRLTIAPPKAPQPDFVVKFLPDALAVSRGSYGRAWCVVTRQAGFAGDLQIAFADLPKGVTCEPVAVAGKGAASTIFAISAAADAPLGSFPVKLVATSKDISKTGLPELGGRVVRQAFLTVLEAPPFTIDVLKTPAEDRKKKEAELSDLEKQLEGETPAAIAAWEKSDAVKSRWALLSPEKEVQAGTGRNTYVRKQEDGSFLVQGANPEKENYLFEARTTLKGITAFRLEAMADKGLPAMGPGRAGNGNFVLSEFKVKAAPASGGEEKPVALHKATVTFAQDGWPIDATLDGSNDTGWAVSPRFGETHTATFETKTPLGFDGGTVLTIALEHQSVHAQHTLGRFRIAVTTAKDPSKGSTLPGNLEAILDTPIEKRTPAQKKELAAHYRSIAPEFQALRDKIARAKGEIGTYPPKGARNAAGTLGVRVTRRPDFKGDVIVTLEGFTVGRDEKTKGPKPSADSLQVSALTLKDGQEVGVLTIQGKPKCDLDTRTVILRGEAKIDKISVVEYSRGIPLTIVEKMDAAPAPAPKAADPKAATKNGITFDCYEGDWDALPDFDALTPVKSGSAADFDLTQRIKDDNFGFRFTGFVQIPKDGEYTFSTVSDDGSRLKVGSTEVVDNDGLHGPEEKSGKITLRKGRHPIRVVFFEKGGGEHLEVFWEGPDLPKQKVPPAALFRAKQEKP